MKNNIIDTDYEEIETNIGSKKKGLGSLIKSYGKLLQANIENKTIRNEAKSVDTRSDSIVKELEKSFMEEINEIAKTSITLTQEDINNLRLEERFQSLDINKQSEIIAIFKKRFEKNKLHDLKTEHKERTVEELEKIREEQIKKIREKMENRIKDIEELYRKAHQDIINGSYEKASQKAEQILEEIKYHKEFVSKLKSFLNSSLFKLKRPTQIFKREKDIMTTLLLPNGRDMVLIELEGRAKDIKGIAKSKMKKQTKELKKDLSHPRNIEQEFIGERETINQGRTIVGFKAKNGVDVLTKRRELYRGDKKVYIVQQRKGQMLYGAISAEGDPITPTYFTKNYKLQGNKLIYEPTENSGEPLEEIDLINPTSK